MISREQARAIAESTVLGRHLGVGVREVVASTELQSRVTMYNMPDLSRCWIAHVDTGRPTILGSSIVVLIDRETGAVLCAGSANDEG